MDPALLGYAMRQFITAPANPCVHRITPIKEPDYAKIMQDWKRQRQFYSATATGAGTGGNEMAESDIRTFEMRGRLGFVQDALIKAIDALSGAVLNERT